MFNPNDPSSSSVGGASGGETGTRNARYVYLVARLRSRQVTMEEATELFGLMQAMLRTSETARQIALRAASQPPPPPSLVGIGIAPPPPMTVTSNASEDFFLMGILAMGAGAGLLAALTKRIQELPSAPASPASDGRSR